MCSCPLRISLFSGQGDIKMKKLKQSITVSLIFFSSLAFASPLVSQWAGTGADADKYYCKYGDGEVKVIYGNQNCPLSN